MLLQCHAKRCQTETLQRTRHWDLRQGWAGLIPGWGGRWRPRGWTPHPLKQGSNYGTLKEQPRNILGLKRGRQLGGGGRGLSQGTRRGGGGGGQGKNVLEEREGGRGCPEPEI